MKYTHDPNKFVWGKSDIIDERFLTDINTIAIKDNHGIRAYIHRRDIDTNKSFSARAMVQLCDTARALWCNRSDLFVGLPITK